MIIDDNTCNVQIVLRSPNAMLYYLGEIYRAQLEANLPGASTDPKGYKCLCDTNFLGIADYDREMKDHTREWRDQGKEAPTLEDMKFVFGSENPCSSEYKLTDEGGGESAFFQIDSDKNFPVFSFVRRLNELYAFEFNGRRYWVPDDTKRRGRTMQAITLVNEIFALNEKASDPPAVTILQGSSR